MREGVARVLLICLKTASNRGDGSLGCCRRTRLATASGFTLIELLIAMGLVGVLAAMASLSMARARQSGNEAAALGSMRAIIGAQAAYAATCGGGGYAQSNADLARAPEGSPPFIPPDLEQADLASTAKLGYVVDVNDNADPDNRDVRPAADSCNAAAQASRAMYHVAADPVGRGVTGSRSFGSDRRGTIYFSTTAAIPNPIPGGLEFIQ